MLTKNFSEVFQRSNTVEIKKKILRIGPLKERGFFCISVPFDAKLILLLLADTNVYLWPFSDLPRYGKSPCFKSLTYFSFQSAAAKKEKKKRNTILEIRCGWCCQGHWYLTDTVPLPDYTMTTHKACLRTAPQPPCFCFCLNNWKGQTQHSYWAFFLPLDVNKGLNII